MMKIWYDDNNDHDDDGYDDGDDDGREMALSPCY